MECQSPCQASRSRRCFPFVAMLLPLALAALLPNVQAASSPGEGQADYLRVAVKGKPMFGESYALRGRRMFFTGRFFIRPENLLWLNDRGEMINEVEEHEEHPVYDAWAAQLSRPPSPHGIRIRLQPAERFGPVLKREKPWEREYVIFKTVGRDGDIYRAWCKSVPGGDCYLESRDGYNWERPILGQKEFESSRENNLLKPVRGGTVFIDDGAPAVERHKAIFGARLKFEQFRAFIERHPERWESGVIKGDWNDLSITFHALQGTTSPDGVHWTILPEPLPVEH